MIAQLSMFAAPSAPVVQAEEDPEVWVNLGTLSDPPEALAAYEVSSKGLIRSLNTHWKGKNGVVLATAAQHNRRAIPLYALQDFKAFGRVASPVLNRNNRQLMVPVHTVVCWAFHGPRPDGHEVDHIDGNPLNNRACNLRWATRDENRANKAWLNHRRQSP